MNTKLTLTIDRSVIEKAKKYASEKGRSLSYIIENYLKIITRDEQKRDVEPISPNCDQSLMVQHVWLK